MAKLAAILAILAVTTIILLAVRTARHAASGSPAAGLSAQSAILRAAKREAEKKGAKQTMTADSTPIVLPPIDLRQPQKFETATFAMGCFWAPDSQFGSVPGVIRTRVGYTGGRKLNPTYHDLGDNTETTEMDFDPAQIGYLQLVQLFFSLHDPSHSPWSQQYKSAIWFHGPEQERVAREVKAQLEKQLGHALYTDILPAVKFYLAEDYHQKYHLKQDRQLTAEFQRLYSDPADFIHSTAVARANGFVGWNGKLELLEAEIGDYGLSPAGEQRLRELAGKATGVHCAY